MWGSWFGSSTALAAGSPAPKESVVPALAGRVVAVLRAPAVVRPKLLAPLETALEVAEARRAAVADGLAALADDLAKLDALEAELGRFDREAEAAHREAETAAGEAVTAFRGRAGAFLRRRTRSWGSPGSGSRPGSPPTSRTSGPPPPRPWRRAPNGPPKKGVRPSGPRPPPTTPEWPRSGTA
ncbi:MAG TPA: hypothetical protein VLF66_16405 [Thermoanaerobaculia bacterium]|nr:hypothetical protein [Thermoanaerobaculia bacterium]